MPNPGTAQSAQSDFVVAEATLSRDFNPGKPGYAVRNRGSITA